MSRRTPLEIIHDILEAVQRKGGSIKPTHLLYKSNLSHQRMQKYVKELMAKGLIEIDENKGKSRYLITDKGIEFLMNYKKIQEFTDAFGL